MYMLFTISSGFNYFKIILKGNRDLSNKMKNFHQFINSSNIHARLKHCAFHFDVFLKQMITSKSRFTK